MINAASVWSHAAAATTNATANLMQKLGAQAVTGASRTAARAVAEAEASILPIRDRQNIRAIRITAEIHLLLPKHPLYKLRNPNTKRFASPLQKLRVRTEELGSS